MTRPDDDTDEKLEVFGRFLEELQSAADVEPVLHRYSEAHPAWAREFREEAAMGRVLDEAKPAAALPDRLEDFRVVRKIASGGMGFVYEAEQISLRRRVALKVRHGVDSPERRAAFEHEQHVLAHLHHSNIVPIHQSGRCGDRQFFVMAFIDGPSLHQVLREAWKRASRNESVPELQALIALQAAAPQAVDPAQFTRTIRDFTIGTGAAAAPPSKQSQAPIRLPSEQFRWVAELIADAADAISHAHSANIVHRDIKPSNIMLDASGHCWIIDFGLAVTSDRDGTDRPGRPSGTPGYIAPERHDANAPEFSPQSDIWSLGATLFESLTLRRPELGGPTVEALVPNVPPDLAAICRKAMHPPESRYGTAMELANDLHHWMEGRPTSARPIGTWRRCAMWCARNRGWAAAWAASALLLAGTTAFLILHADHRAEQAELRSQVAEAEAAEERRAATILERDSWLMDAQRLPGIDAVNGWFPKAWSLLEHANAIQPDSKVRDLAVASLRGMDVEPIRILPFGGSSIVFDRRSDRLLIGGWSDVKGKRLQTARVWSIGADQFVESGRMGDGPVAFTTTGRPRQLIRDPGSLVLWEMDAGTELWRTALPGDPLDASTIALSESGDLVAASAETDERPRTRVWRPGTTQPLLETAFRSGAIAFSTDGEFVAMADELRRRVVIHSLLTGKPVAELPGDSLPVRGMAFGRNPKPSNEPLGRWRLATGDSGGTVSIWNLDTRLPLNHCRGMLHEVSALAFSPDGTLLATGGRGQVRLWDVTAAKCSLVIAPPQGLDYVTQVAFSPDGESLGISSLGVFYSPTVSLWRINDRRGLQTLRGFTAQVERITVSPDSRFVAALAQNWTVGIWDLTTGHLLRILDVPIGSFPDNAALEFSRDSRTLAYSVGSPTGTKVVLIDVASGQQKGSWNLPPGLQNTMACDESGNWMHFQVELERGHAMPYSHYLWQEHPRVGRIRKLGAESSPKPLAEVREFTQYMFIARFTPDARHLVVDGIARDGVRSIKVFRGDTGQTVSTFPTGQRARASDLTLDENGRTIWVSDSEVVHRIPLPAGPDQAASGLSVLGASDAASLYCCRYHGKDAGCVLVRATDLTVLANLSLSVSFNGVAFDPAGRRLIWGTPEGQLVVCELPKIQERLRSLGYSW